MECRNPYIENFIRKLVETTEKDLEPVSLERRIESLYVLLENMLGRNMVAGLPEELRTQFQSQYGKGIEDIDPQKMSQLFDQYIENPEAIMKKTLQEFADLYFQNR